MLESFIISVIRLFADKKLHILKNPISSLKNFYCPVQGYFLIKEVVDI